MGLQKQALSSGMIGVISFILSDILGCILVQGYNPIKSYISVLSADQTPHSSIMRILIIIYQVFFLIFSITLCIKFFKGHYFYARVGSILLFGIACLSLITFGVFPMTAESAINPQNIIHLILAIAIIALPPIALFLLSLGYRQHELNFLRNLSLTAAIFIVLFNLLHLVGIKNEWNILGLIQRLSVYTFHAFTFFSSRIYVRTESRAWR
ncbi:DUF998 domain-containing protein [Faecalispora anaeroviscerum]|uniref:DUF998 domain-containing protein n=1 Tax=Faecalispora anaeroviscerum TaxID=2991836 RepID=UPI0024BAFE60|nr:DUF998 domain-containing protein [Faecalispora anaeroviscerum]